MKHLFFISAAWCIFSLTVFKAAAQAPVFIEHISFTPNASTDNTTLATHAGATNPDLIHPPSITASGTGSISTEMCSRLQFKFAQLLNRNIETITNIPLFSTIDDWWQTRYRYGGTTKKGIDCSAFAGLLMTGVYGFKIPRTTKEQYQACEKISKNNMVEGDLVFFNTRGGVSHVGVYLGDGYFVHASVSNGVKISNLNEVYYEDRFIGGGRMLNAGYKCR